jgi:outer membrane protein TolC
MSARAQQREMQLSLREATAFALQGNLEIQIAGLTPRIREAQVAERKGIFNVEARAALRASHSRLLDTTNTFREEVVNQLVGQDDSQEQQLAFGIAQLTPSGGTYEVEFSESHLDTSRTTTATEEAIVKNRLPLDAAPHNEFFRGELRITGNQPLLRNFGSRITKTQILIAQNNLYSSKEEFRQQVIAVASRVQQTYWELVFRRQDLEVIRQQRASAQRLLEQIRKQVAVGTLAPLEVVQAETDIARVDERILVAENAVRAAEDRLKRVMNLSLVGEFADVVILPTDAPQYADPVINQNEQIRQALDNRTDLIQAKLALENQQITLVFDKNQALPRLDLEASLRINGIDTKFTTSFGEVDPRNRYRWDVGLVFRYPLANQQAKSRVEQSRLAVQQQMLRIQNLEENVITEVRAAVRDVTTNAQRVQASRVARRLAEKQLEAEEKKLQVGLATVFTVLQFQDELSVERSNEINALTEYLRALVRLEEVKSTLLQSYNIVLQPDGPRFQ